MAKRAKYPRTIKTDYGTVVIRRNKAGGLFWRGKGKNGETISGSTEGHDRIGTVLRSISLTGDLAYSAELVLAHERERRRQRRQR